MTPDQQCLHREPGAKPDPSTGPAGGNPAELDATVYIARQAVFDHHQQVYGYELLFRNGAANACDNPDGNQATRATLNNTLNVIGFDELIGRHFALVNITEHTLLEHEYTIMPPKQTIIELLETVEPTPRIVQAARHAQSLGYTLALDDFVLRDDYDDLLAIADLIKVDFMLSDLAHRELIIQRYARPGLSFLAEKVETQDDFHHARSCGYRYFQGYFFCKPQVTTGRDIPTSKHNQLLFLQQLHQSPMDFNTLESIIHRDASLSVKLLKYLNSAALGVRERIRSIKQALLLLGEQPLRRWGSLVATTCLACDKPLELVRICLARAHFCETIADRIGLETRQFDLFMLGLLSGLDALLDRPMDQLLDALPLAGDVKATLLGSSTPLGKLHLLVQACERGDWENAELLCGMLKVSPRTVASLHRQSLQWADRMIEL